MTDYIGKFLSVVSPMRAAQRLQAKKYLDIVNSSYDGASRSRRATQEWTISSGTSDEVTLIDIPELRVRSRDLMRNAPLALGAANVTVNNVVGTGLKLRARIDRSTLNLSDDEADELEDRIEKLWRLWAGSSKCDAEQSLNFADIQRLCVLSTFESGDCFVVLVDSPSDTLSKLRIQVVEADRVSNPDSDMDSDKYVAGISRGTMGEPTAYYIRDTNFGEYAQSNFNWIKIPALGNESGRRNVLHLHKKLRPGQSRGVPALAPVIESLKQLKQYSDAEVMAAVIASMFTVFVKSEGGQPFQYSDQVSNPAQSSHSATKKLAPGMIVQLDQGSSIDIADPNRPNSNFDPFIAAIQQQIGSALGIPFEVLRSHFSSSYSASKAALGEAWKNFQIQRSWVASKLCQPVYEEWFTDAVGLGHIKAPGFLGSDPVIRAAYLGADWVGPAPSDIDPVKTVTAAKMRIDTELSTRSDEAAALGGDWDRIHAQRAKEERLRVQDGTIPAAEMPQINAPEDKEQEEREEERADDE